MCKITDNDNLDKFLAKACNKGWSFIRASNAWNKLQVRKQRSITSSALIDKQYRENYCKYGCGESFVNATSNIDLFPG